MVIKKKLTVTTTIEHANFRVPLKTLVTLALLLDFLS